jgi:hypothetical protein
LVGIEQAVELRLGSEPVRAQPDQAHAAQLTREETTASVHYVRFVLTPAQVQRFAARPVELAVAHPAYSYAASLSEATKVSLLRELTGSAD